MFGPYDDGMENGRGQFLASDKLNPWFAEHGHKQIRSPQSGDRRKERIGHRKTREVEPGGAEGKRSSAALSAEEWKRVGGFFGRAFSSD